MRSPQAWAEVIEPSINRNEWPPDAMTELLAIAQHHGVPTRLIDFSHSAMKATFFAASGALAWSRAPRKRDRPTKTARFAVWALNLNVLHGISNGGETTISVVTVPRAQNRFLHAQDGVFLFDRNAYVAGNAPTRMEQVFLAWEHHLKGAGSLSANDHLIMRVTAPVSEAEAPYGSCGTRASTRRRSCLPTTTWFATWSASATACRAPTSPPPRAPRRPRPPAATSRAPCSPPPGSPPRPARARSCSGSAPRP